MSDNAVKIHPTRKRMRKAREEAGISQRVFANLVEIPRRTVRRWEQNYEEPATDEEIELWANTLDPDGSMYVRLERYIRSGKRS